jgi:hypothetical protein
MQNFFHSERFPILALLAVLLVIGLFTLTHYGESWDELQFYKYADRDLASYGTSLQTTQVILTGNTYDDYGPAYVMLNAVVAAALKAVLPGVLLSDLRHFIYFLTYLAGAYAFYILARRWMSAWAAMAATLLFVTQPVLWGHAFISPKDIPFLSGFLISLALGLHMVDARPEIQERPPRALLWLAGIWVASLLFLFCLPQIPDGALAAAIRGASADPTSFLGTLLRNLSSSFARSKPEAYVERALVALLWMKLLYLLLSTTVLAWFARTYVPSVFRFLPLVLPAAVALGFTISIRILGPLAGLLVAIYAWGQSRHRAWLMLGAYAGIALAVMLVTWPYLWADPIGHLIESWGVMTQYPWPGQVLFNGQYYRSDALPRSYLPLLLAIQITEPIWPLFLLSLGLLWKNKYLLICTALWFVLPLAGLIIEHSPLYDNFRQVIFALPPVFFACGLGLDWLFQRLRQPLVRGAITAALVLPGLVAGIQLHPYEYIYYNSFIGGLPGAQGRFETDYWATSYRAAMQYVNSVAPSNGKIFAAGPSYIAALYARRDLRMYMDIDMHTQVFDYAILTTRYHVDQTDFPGAPVVYVIQREGVPLTVIKKIGAQP